MNASPNLVPFRAEWPDPDLRFLQSELPPPPDLPLEEVMSPRWAAWVRTAAEAKAAPPDYIFAALLTVCGTLIGNTRWSSPWTKWTEPPVLWIMAIGNPSMNKSPGLDAVLEPLKRAERAQRAKAKAGLAKWREKAEVAELAEGAWKGAVKVAIKDEIEPPSRPATANPGPEPVMPRLAVSDITVEKLAVILASQPRGMLLARDELAGWLQGMTRYSGGGTDRPFWLEAYGGRSYSVERMGRDPVDVDHLTVGVLGGIQPDRLRSLMIKADDDGLLARFIPIWPRPAPVRRPSASYDEAFIDAAIGKLLALEMVTDHDGPQHSHTVPFSEDAQAPLDSFRQKARDWEAGAEGLLLSFIGKLPGLAVRLSLVLGMMDWASGESEEPQEINAAHLGRATHLIESYFLPMARRAYAEAACGKEERVARRLVALIQEREWRQFTSREVMRSGRAGLSTAEDLRPGLRALEEADLIRHIAEPSKPQGGRPLRLFTVNPILHRRSE